MIPNRRPRIRPIEEMEITDADIVEVQPKPRSGTYAAVRPPPVPGSLDPVVRVSLESLSDEEYAMMDTALNDVTVALARLSMQNRSATIPRLRGAVELNALSSEEAWLVSLVTAGYS
jgi:hypothetical protein